MNQQPFENSGYIEKVVRRLVDRGMAQASEIRGCTSDEVDELSAIWQIPLPAAYKEFLFRMGRGAGRFFVGTDIFYPKALKLREYLTLYQGEQPLFRPPPDAIAFAMHQGYQVLYICANDGDDPSVYHHLEYEKKTTLVDQRFSDFLIGVSRDE